MKIFKERSIAKTAHNYEILSIWSEVQQQFLADLDSEDFHYQKDKEQAIVLDSNGAKVFSWLYEKNIHLGDAGTKIILKSLHVPMDIASENFLRDFTHFLTDAALSMGLNADIDKDLTDSCVNCDNEYALIIEIMERTAAEILSSEGERNVKNKRFLSIFTTMIERFSSLSWLSTDKAFFSGKITATSFTKHFLGEIEPWTNSLNFKLEEGKILNIVKNTIHNNQSYLITLKEKVQRYLYIHLTSAINSISPTPSECLPKWIDPAITQIEKQIFSSRTNGNCLETNKGDLNLILATNGSNSLIQKQKGIEFCIILREQYGVEEEHVEIIRNLYEALHSIEGMVNVVERIDSLTGFMGCVPFLFKGINTIKLDSCLDICITKSNNACVKEYLKDSIITIVESRNAAVGQYKKLTFDNIMTHRAALTRGIRTTLLELEASCIYYGFEGVLDSSFLEGIKSITLYNDLPAIKDTPEVEEKKAMVLKSYSLLGAIEAPRENLYRLWKIIQDDKDDVLWKYIQQEAFHTLTDKELPTRLVTCLLEQIHSQSTVAIYNRPFIELNKICEDIRNDIFEDSEKYLSKKDIDLIQYLKQNKSPYLQPYIKELQAYQKNVNESNLMLTEAVNHKKFILAYFSYYYLENQNDLVYIPFIPTTIKALAETMGIAVIIHESTKTSNSNPDNTNSCAEPKKVFDIVYDNNSYVPFTVTVKTISSEIVLPIVPVIKQDKSAFYAFLFNTINNEELTSANKRKILEYYLTKDNSLAEVGIQASLQMIKAAESTLNQFNKDNKNLDSEFLAKGLDYIYSKLVAHISAMNPATVIKKSLITELSNLLTLWKDKYIDDHIVDTYLNSPYLYYPMIHFKNSPLLVLAIENAPSNAPLLLAFKTDSGLHYLKKPDGTYSSFKEQIIKGEAVLNSVKIPEIKNLIETLNKAIKNSEHRALLAIDIKNAYKTYSLPEQKLSINTPKEWNNLFDLYIELKNKLEELERYPAFSLILNGNQYEPKQLLDILNGPVVSQRLTKEELQKVIELEATIRELDQLNENMNKYCAKKSVCEHYINLLNKEQLGVGRYALNIYAREHAFSLIIYNTLRIDTGISFITKDNHASYHLPTSNSVVQIIYKSENHFDILTSIPQEPTPQLLMAGYVEQLRTKLTENVKKYNSMKEGEPLSAYNKQIKVHANNAIALASLTEIEKQTVLKCNEIMSGGFELQKELIERQTKWNSLISENQLARWIPLLQPYNDMMVLADEARNDKNETMLYQSIQNNELSLINSLLAHGACVTTINGDACTILPEGSILSNKAIYLLGLTAETKWSLSYYSTPTTPVKFVPISKVTGLESALKELDSPENAINQYEVISLIEGYHAKNKLQTSLMLAARKVGFSETNSLFFTLLNCASEEAQSKTEEVKEYRTLKYFSTNVTPKFSTQLQSYKNLQEERVKSLLYQCAKSISYLFSMDLSQIRAEELAFAFEYLVNGEKTHNYREMVDHFRGLLNKMELKTRSELYLRLEQTLEEAESWMTTNTLNYHQDFKNYHGAQSSIKQSKLVNDVERLSRSEVKNEQQLLLVKQEVAENTKRQIDLKNSSMKSEEELKEMLKKREAEIIHVKHTLTKEFNEQLEAMQKEFQQERLETRQQLQLLIQLQENTCLVNDKVHTNNNSPSNISEPTLTFSSLLHTTQMFFSPAQASTSVESKDVEKSVKSRIMSTLNTTEPKIDELDRQLQQKTCSK